MDFLFQTPTPNLDLSIAYFKKLGFDIIQKREYTIVHDSQLKIRIDANPKSRTGVCLVKENWDAEVEALKKITKVIDREEDYFFVDPSGCWFKLETAISEKIQASDSRCALGNFAGLSLETIDMERSAELLSCLGFEQTMGALEQGWLTYADKYQNTVSLMAPFSCPHLFFNPSLTFFNGAQNGEIIQGLRDLSVPIAEEITAFNTDGKVDNVIIQEPGGYGFFIFSD